MIYEATICMRFSIDIIDGIQVILKAFINSNSVAFSFASIVGH